MLSDANAHTLRYVVLRCVVFVAVTSATLAFQLSVNGGWLLSKRRCNLGVQPWPWPPNRKM